MIKKLLFSIAFLMGISIILQAQVDGSFKDSSDKLTIALEQMTYQNPVLPTIDDPEVVIGKKHFIRKEPLRTEFNHFNQSTLVSYPLDLSNELKNSWSVKFKVRKTNFRYFLRP